jgi:hypothetical protein
MLENKKLDNKMTRAGHSKCVNDWRLVNMRSGISVGPSLDKAEQ